MISDGQNNASRYTYRELQRLLKESDVQVYCIGIVETQSEDRTRLDQDGQMVLEQISQVSGGHTAGRHSHRCILIDCLLTAVKVS